MISFEPNKQSEPSLWERLLDWLTGKSPTQTKVSGKKPKAGPDEGIALSDNQKLELQQAVENTNYFDTTSFYRSDTDFRKKSAPKPKEEPPLII